MSAFGRAIKHLAEARLDLDEAQYLCAEAVIRVRAKREARKARRQIDRATLDEQWRDAWTT